MSICSPQHLRRSRLLVNCFFVAQILVVIGCAIPEVSVVHAQDVFTCPAAPPPSDTDNTATGCAIGQPAGDSLAPVQPVSTSSQTTVVEYSGNRISRIEQVMVVIAACIYVLGISWGVPSMFWGFFDIFSRTPGGGKRATWGLIATLAGLLSPPAVHYIFAELSCSCTFS